jgi:hypothetical protein
MVFCAPTSIALYSKGFSSGCGWKYLGAYCITADSQLGMLYQDTCTGVVLCVAGVKSGFAPTASLGPGGHVQIAGHAACAEGAVADLRVTITQRGTGAIAEGTTRIACRGGEVPWDLQASTVGRGALSAGPATACGLLRVPGGDDPPDAFQWCRDDIELVEP